MPHISSRFKNISESKTVALTALAAQLKRQGKDVISLGAGEPDFATPEFIAQAGIRAIQSGDTKYTAVNGLFDLRDAISKWIQNERGATFSPEDIIVTNGAKHAVYQSILAVCDPGDEILIPAPYWVSYPEMVKMAGGIVKTIKPEKDNLKITANQLEKAITSKTRALIFNSPSNPSGAVYSRAELAEIVAVVQQHDIYVISDEIYDQIIFDDLEYASFCEFESVRDQLVYINGVSKGFAMTGWRIGFLAAHRDIINAIKKYQGHSTTNASTISQRAALAAYLGDKSFIGEMISAYQQRRGYVMQRLVQIRNVTCANPQGTFYAFPDVSSYYRRDKGITNSLELCTYLLEQFEIGLVPGAAFGLDRHVRLSFATSMSVLERAMDRMESGLRSLQH